MGTGRDLKLRPSRARGPRRRHFVPWAWLLVAPSTHAQPALPLRSLVVLDFEVLEDHPQPDRAAAQAERARNASAQLRDALAQADLYHVLDPAAGESVVKSLRDRHTWLHRCTECAQTIGRAAGSELVLLPWAQVVSQLIVNLNVELRETDSDRVLLNKSVDLRGNNDESWARGIRFMVREWAERRAANPRYGR